MSKPEMNPVVRVTGRHVVVEFDLPFMAGDPCIPPHHPTPTTVATQPVVGIQLSNNLKDIQIQAEGAWYVACHGQLWGTDQYLPDFESFLSYWLATKDRAHFEDRLGMLRQVFAKDATALKRLDARLVEMLAAEVASEKAALGEAMVSSTQKVMQLEAAIAKAKGGKS